MAITQKALSVRLNKDLLCRLDNYCKEKGAMRNRVINQAIEQFLTTSS